MSRKLLRLVIASACAAFAARAEAAWTGNPTLSLDGGAAGLGYQVSSRDLENTDVPGSPAVDFDARGLVLEQRTSLSPVVQLAFRILPFTGRLNLDGSSFNPHVAGAGVGFYFSPPEAFGPVHLGAAVIWDGAGGARRRPNSTSKTYDRFYSSELTLAAAASVSPFEFMNIFGGASYVSYRAQFSLPGGKTKWKQDSPWGAFGGVSLTSNDVWVLTAELRVGGERSMSASLGYKY